MNKFLGLLLTLSLAGIRVHASKSNSEFGSKWLDGGDEADYAIEDAEDSLMVDNGNSSNYSISTLNALPPNITTTGVTNTTTTTSTSTTTTTTSTTTTSDANGTATFLSRHQMGMPFIVELALRQQYKFPDKVVDRINQLVKNSFLALSSPTTTVNTTASKSTNEVTFMAVDPNLLQSVLESFSSELEQAACSIVPDADQQAIMLGKVKKALCHFITLVSNFHVNYRQYSDEVKLQVNSQDLFKGAIEALSHEWRFAEKAMIKSDDLFRNNMLWINKTEYTEAVGLAKSSKTYFDGMCEMVEEFFDKDFSKALFDKKNYDAFNFDIHIMNEFYRGLDYFRSVLRDVDQEARLLEEANKHLVVHAEEKIEFTELVTLNLSTLKATDWTEKGKSNGLPYLVSTYLEHNASAALKTLTTLIGKIQTDFIAKVQGKKIKTEQDLNSHMNSEIEKLIKASSLADEFKEPLELWLRGWFWTAAVGMPLKDYQYQRLLQHSLTEDLHLYTAEHEKTYDAIMELGKSDKLRPASKRTLYQAAIEMQNGLMASQKAFMSLGYVKLLPARDLHNDHFKKLRKGPPPVYTFKQTV